MSFCVLNLAQIKNIVLLKKSALIIKKIREDAGITLAAFYFDTGIHLERIEQGKTNITLSTLSIICSYFEISLSGFFIMLEEL